MRDGERVEFEWVFRSAYPSVLRTVYLISHDRGRAEEITQDAFLRLYERWRGVVRIDHPEAWVRQVAVRSAIRHAQRSRLLSLVSQVEDSGEWDRVPDVDLAHSIAELPPRQRAVVALFYLEDRSTWQVSSTPLEGVSGLDFRTNRLGLAVNESVSRSTDGGASWQLADEPPLAFNGDVAWWSDLRGDERPAVTGAQRTAFAVREASFVSRDRGKSWEQFSPEGFFSIECAEGTLACWASGEDGKIARLTVS